MYVPAGLLFVLALWFLVTHDNRPIPGWLYVVGLLTCAVYAPWNTLIVGTIVAIVLLPIGLFLLCAGSMHLLEKGAKALPACWLFDGPSQPSKAVETKPVVPFTAKDVDWDWRYDDTDYPSGRH